MAHYIVMAKYTPAALAQVRAAGYASRLAQMRAAIEGGGGRIIGDVLFLDGTEWDFIGIVEGGADLNFALGPWSAASGIFDEVRYLEARTADQMDAIANQHIDWQPPGR